MVDVQCANALDVLVENDELLEVVVLDEIDLVRQTVNTIDDDEVVVLLLYDTHLDDLWTIVSLDELDENDYIDTDDEVGDDDVDDDAT